VDNLAVGHTDAKPAQQIRLMTQNRTHIPQARHGLCDLIAQHVRRETRLTVHQVSMLTCSSSIIVQSSSTVSSVGIGRSPSP
jgi:hypothetical protein